LAALDTTYASITRNLEYSVRRVDAFFADEKIFQEATDSYLQVEGRSVWKERKGARFGGDIKARAVLPRLERKWALLFESDGQAARDNQHRLRRRPKEVVKKNNYLLSLQKRLNGGTHWDIRPSAGVKLHIPPDPFARINAYRYYNLGSWLGRASADMSWFVSDGFGSDVQWELDHAPRSNLLFRSTSSLDWQEKHGYFRGEQKVTLFHDFDDKDAFAYEAGISITQKKAWGINEYYVRANYRRQVARRWLYLDVTPEVSYPRGKDFRPQPSLTVSLGVIFGRQYLKPSKSQ